MVAERKTLAAPDLRHAVLRELEQTAQVNVSDMSIEAENGLVTLEGLVRSRRAKDAAENAVAHVSGVKAIVSELEIKPLVERNDTDIARDILRAFKSHVILNVDNVRVIVSGGRVRLEGSVHSQFQRLLAEAAAKGVRGLRDIQNDLTIEAPTVSGYSEGRIAASVAPQEDFSNDGEGWIETGAAEAG
jgi:osmotically-inducible protein OsmY